MMRARSLFIAAALLCAAVPAFGQNYARPLQPVAGAQFNVSLASVVSLTVPNGPPAPSAAMVCVTGSGGASYTTGGSTPTASNGLYIAAGSCQFFYGPAVLAASRFIAASGTPVLQVEFYAG